ncbi:GNAT family N-acetyltransferase [Caldicellulosiruptoraceae bacterium PP1]
MFLIRLAQNNDKEKIHNFANINNIKLYQKSLHIVVEIDNNIIGLLQFIKKNCYSEILSVFIIEGFRGQYFGDGLVKTLINYCYNNNIELIKINLSDFNTFFEKIGFINKGNYLELNVFDYFNKHTCK